MVEQTLPHGTEVVQRRGETRAGRTDDAAGADGPEFSSEPMPAAHGALISAGIGLLITVICVAVFW